MISFEAGSFSSNAVILRFPTPKEGSLNLIVKIDGQRTGGEWPIRMGNPCDPKKSLTVSVGFIVLQELRPAPA